MVNISGLLDTIGCLKHKASQDLIGTKIMSEVIWKEDPSVSRSHQPPASPPAQLLHSHLSSTLQLCGVWRISPLDSFCELQEMEETSSGKPSFTLSFSKNKKRLWEYCLDAHKAHTYAGCKIKEDFTSNSNFLKKSHKHFGGLKFQLGTFPSVHSAYGDCWDLPVHSKHNHTAAPVSLALTFALVFCFLY